MKYPTIRGAVGLGEAELKSLVDTSWTSYVMLTRGAINIKKKYKGKNNERKRKKIQRNVRMSSMKEDWTKIKKKDD